MRPLDRRYTKVVLWKKVGVDKQGQSIVQSPEEINVRWSRRRLETREQTSTGEVIEEEIIHQENSIPIGSIVWKGSLRELPAGTTIPDLFQTVTSVSVDALIREVKYKTCGIVRHSNKLPTVQS